MMETSHTFSSNKNQFITISMFNLIAGDQRTPLPERFTPSTPPFHLISKLSSLGLCTWSLDFWTYRPQICQSCQHQLLFLFLHLHPKQWCTSRLRAESAPLLPLLLRLRTCMSLKDTLVVLVGDDDEETMYSVC